MKLNYSQKILILSLVLFIGVLILDIVFSNLLFGKIVNINNKNRQLDLSTQEREREIVLKDSIISTQGEREKLEQYFFPFL